MSSETVWNWIQSKGKLFKIISNPVKGTIEVLNEQGEILIRKTNLTQKQVEIVEKNFLRRVAHKLKSNGQPKGDDSFDPMIT